jgi:hypothetical protein
VHLRPGAHHQHGVTQLLLPSRPPARPAAATPDRHCLYRALTTHQEHRLGEGLVVCGCCVGCRKTPYDHSIFGRSTQQRLVPETLAVSGKWVAGA